MSSTKMFLINVIINIWVKLEGKIIEKIILANLGGKDGQKT